MINIEPIENGTVIDHIRAGMGAKVLKALGIGDGYPYQVALVMHAQSSKIGKKDIVKIAEKIINEKEANVIALLSPGATINIIAGGKVIRKYTVDFPDKIDEGVVCPNPACITNHEENTRRIFMKKSNGQYRCYFCERVFGANEIVQ